MSFPPPPATRGAENHGAIAPQQLWAQLTPHQQQRLRRALIVVAQHLLANLPGEPPHEDPLDER
jgi:hypothetical protein